MTNTVKIFLVWGGTGGHIFPLINLTQYLRAKNFVAEFHWIGEKNSLEEQLSVKNSIIFSAIICGKLRRYFSFETLLLPFQVLMWTIQSLGIILREKPKAIFSKGGYVSLPVAIAGYITGVPVYLHESDSVPGLANRIVAKFATGIFTSFVEVDTFFEEKKILGHGHLFPPEIGEILAEKVPLQEKTKLLVSCGSQGSSRVFDALIPILPSITDMDIHIVLGTKNLEYRKKIEGFPNVTMYDFFFDQKEYFRLIHASDIIITRSSSSIFEFEAFGLHMILVPLPESGNNHQYHNARIFEKKGHECILQENLSAELATVLDKYRTFKKTWWKKVVDMSIFDTIAQTLFQ